MDVMEWMVPDYMPKHPARASLGIGIVGTGEIVQTCHLPAYRMAGFHVVGVYDSDPDKAHKVAGEFGIDHVFPTLTSLLAHPEVDIVDIAVPARFQPDIVEQAAKHGKHVLCQKPLAESYEEAKRIVAACEAAGVKGAVNQQMRWAPGIRASHSLIRRGFLGTPVQASIQVNVFTDWANWPWITGIDKLEVMFHSIHYLDALRFLFGTPEYVYADGAKYPGQVCKGETRTMIHMKFPGDARGLIHDNHNNWAPQDDWYATFRFEGTDGLIKGTNGALYDYPTGRADTIQYMSRVVAPNRWLSPALEGRWFPHAFIGTMGELMMAIEEDREAENSVQDNLQTMKMLFAVYQSMEENRPVTLDCSELDR